MVQWIAVLHGECWNEMLEIKESRQKNKLAARSRQPHTLKPPHTRSTDEKDNNLKKKYDRAKRFVNVGEYSKAIDSLLTNGTARISSAVLDQLKSKHPARNKTVKWPQPPKIGIPEVT